jgi:hypothetical protein
MPKSVLGRLAVTGAALALCASRQGAARPGPAQPGRPGGLGRADAPGRVRAATVRGDPAAAHAPRRIRRCPAAARAARRPARRGRAGKDDAEHHGRGPPAGARRSRGGRRLRTAAGHRASPGGGPVGAGARQPPAGRRPPTAYPARPERTEPRFPSRDFAQGHGWGLPPRADAPQARSPGVVGLLSTSVDDPADWIHAGQALQRVPLLASSCGAAAALHSQPLELPQLREFIRTQLSGRAHPADGAPVRGDRGDGGERAAPGRRRLL